MGTNQINGNDEIEIDLLEVFHVLLKKWWLILGTAAVFGLVSLAFTAFFITPQYRSVTKMYHGELGSEKKHLKSLKLMQILSILSTTPSGKSSRIC